MPKPDMVTLHTKRKKEKHKPKKTPQILENHVLQHTKDYTQAPVVKTCLASMRP
jgi:hypothetical protein